jgi:CubicO group peptidase (beta-lactamase class C family)
MSLGLILLLATSVTPPPAAVAVTFDRAGKMETRIADGFADPARGRVVTGDDPVRVASVSKLVVALGVMRLVEAGRLDLDRDVSDYLGWRLRHPAWPDRPITLAQLLGHRAGLTDDIDYALPLDADLEAELAKPAAWDRTRPPGGRFRLCEPQLSHRRGGHRRGDRRAVRSGDVAPRLSAAAARRLFQLADVQRRYSRARGRRFATPTGRCFATTLAAVRPECPVVPATDGGCDLARYRLAHHGAGFSPQGGLRISANGLARIGIMLLRRGDGFLKPESLARLEAMAPVHPASGEGTGGFFCEYGTAMHSTGGPALADPACRDDLFGDGRRRLGHSGDAYGLRSGLWFDLEAWRRHCLFHDAGAGGAERGHVQLIAARKRC